MLECRQWCVHLHIVYHEYLSLSLFADAYFSLAHTHSSYFFFLSFFALFLLHLGLILPFLVGFHVWYSVEREMFFLIFGFFSGLILIEIQMEKCYCGNMSTYQLKIFDIAFILSTLFQIRCIFLFLLCSVTVCCCCARW